MTPRERKKLIKELDAINVRQNTIGRTMKKGMTGNMTASDWEEMILRRDQILKELNPYNAS